MAASNPTPVAESESSSYQASEPEQEINDGDLAEAVRVRLIADDPEVADHLSVEAGSGVVTLVGTVGNLYEKRRAVEIAERIKGTRAVVAEIAVEPVQRPDQQILEDVRFALFRDPATESYALTPSVSDGVVTLHGTVGSWAEKRIASEAVERVAGVRSLVNEVVVHSEALRNDSDIQRDVDRVLQIDALVDDNLIRTQVDDGRVKLSGTVGSLAEKHRAMEDARVAGVTSVDASGLSVEWWERDRFRRSLPAIYDNDLAISRAVRDAFLFDPRVTLYEPDVEVHNGTATLSGEVPTLDAKRAAEADARDTVGVLWVVDDIEVHPRVSLDDDLLEHRILRAFNMDPVLRDREGISVSVSDGVALLSGQVRSHSEKQRVEQDAAQQRGIVDVRNEIAVVDHGLTDGELHEAIEQDLIWNPWVVATNVLLSVNNGEVTLQGAVANWRAYREAAEVASKDGAKRVINELRVVAGSGRSRATSGRAS